MKFVVFVKEGRNPVPLSHISLIWTTEKKEIQYRRPMANHRNLSCFQISTIDHIYHDPLQRSNLLRQHSQHQLAAVSSLHPT